jgi:hypothetical protein
MDGGRADTQEQTIGRPAGDRRWGSAKLGSPAGRAPTAFYSKVYGSFRAGGRNRRGPDDY